MMQRARVAWAAAFRAPFVAHRMSPAPLAVMVALLVLSHTSLWAASCSDPGILPRASVVGAVPDAPSAPALAAATARYEPILRAVSATGSPASRVSLSISRTRRMAILSVGIGLSKRKNPSVEEAAPGPPTPGGIGSESLAG